MKELMTIKMRKIINLIAVVLAVTIPAGCGSKIKRSEAVPTVDEVAVTAAPTATPTAAESTPIAEEKQNTEAPETSVNDTTKEASAPAVSKSKAEKLVLEATGATGLKLVAEGEAYVFDCYQGDSYMGTVEVNATSGELTFH